MKSEWKNERRIIILLSLIVITGRFLLGAKEKQTIDLHEPTENLKYQLTHSWDTTGRYFRFVQTAQIPTLAVLEFSKIGFHQPEENVLSLLSVFWGFNVILIGTLTKTILSSSAKGFLHFPFIVAGLSIISSSPLIGRNDELETILYIASILSACRLLQIVKAPHIFGGRRMYLDVMLFLVCLIIATCVHIQALIFILTFISLDILGRGPEKIYTRIGILSIVALLTFQYWNLSIWILAFLWFLLCTVLMVIEMHFALDDSSERYLA
jgi:hypothetical protein